ncbi:MAG: tRNA (N6-isopentenyl adenosine(37)-C2)-methylthiotransferase MiaB [Thermodesulfobacteriota bacterium]
MNALAEARPKPGKLVFIETFGCQMNDNDSDRILGFLAPLDYSAAASPDEADLIILNTCSVRDKAEQKVYSMLGRFKGFKGAGGAGGGIGNSGGRGGRGGSPGVILAVGGCVAQQEGERLLRRVPYLDLVFGPHNIHRLPELLRRIERSRSGAGAGGGERVAATAFNDAIEPGEYAAEQAPAGVRANVSIMRGCDNFCAYCIVPHTRGREVSRGSLEIVTEVTRLAAAGVREVTLLGQNVNSYGRGTGVGFPELLRRVAAVDGMERIRFVTSHPRDMSTELIGLFGEEKKLARHLHLPVQSGSDRVLDAMGRGYTRAAYMEKVEALKALYPDMALTTDIIVGFPGETEEDFELTCDLIKTVRYDNIFSFKYSERPGTRAARLGGRVGAGVKARRLRTLQDTQREITMAKNLLLVGTTREVLVEGPSKQNPAELTGRTTCNRIVNFPGAPSLAGSAADVVVTDAFANSLRGRLPGADTERSLLCS